MFGATDIADAPLLPATSLEDNCYESMFYGCKNLGTGQTVVSIAAKTSANSAMSRMFYGCTNLGKIALMFMSDPDEAAYSEWAKEVAPNGILYLPPGSEVSNMTPYKGTASEWSVLKTLGADSSSP